MKKNRKPFNNYMHPLYGLVITCMEYAAPVWDPHLREDHDLFDHTQFKYLHV